MDIDYYEVFGLEAPAEETGATVQEAAEPAPTQEPETGATVQEAADPAGNDMDDGGEEPGSSHGDDGSAQGTQSAEDNARYAAARRKAEQERDAAVARAREEAKAEYERQMNEVFARSGMVNPYTKTPIRNKAEYDAYMDRHAQEQKATLIQKSGMSQEQFDAFVNGLPQVRQAEEQSRQAQVALNAARDAQAKAKIDQQVQQIHAIDPTINSVADFQKMENYQQFYEKVKAGMNFYDAYRLVNYDRLVSDSAAKAKQAAMNNQASKAHLTRTQSRGQGAIEVPESVLSSYRMLMPNLTDAEIAAHYTAYLKQKK